MTQETRVHCFGEIYYNVPVSTAERPIETLFEGLPKEQQYWRRQKDFPNFFYDYNPHLPDKKLCRINALKTQYVSGKLVSLSVEDTQELMRLTEREVRRIQRGIFIWNNGVKIYFPGAFYGALQHGKMIGVSKNDGYGQHRRYQREFACQRQKAIDDDRLDGYYVDKIKKCGISQLIALFYCMESIVKRQFTAAFMSKNHDTAKAANFKYYTYALKNLPDILKPSIEQRNWASAIQKVEIRINDSELSLENVVVAVSTVPDAVDGLPPVSRVCLSEMPKMDEAEAILIKTREQLRIQKTKIGIIEAESYPPEDDTKSFSFCKNLWEVECHKIDEDGYPLNKILPLYIGLLEATNGTHDVYGEPNKFLALEMEKKELEKCNTAAKIQARNRQYHMTPKQSWQVGGGGSLYNNMMLGEQVAVLEEELKFERPYMEGFLEWTETPFNSPVRFVKYTTQDLIEGKEGKWKFYCTQEYLDKNTNLCFQMPRKKKIINEERHILLQPPNDVIHAAGTDPVDYAYKSRMGNKQSTNASTVRDIRGNLISHYYYRGEDPDESLEDFCLQMIFLGTYEIVEGNRKNAVTTLEKLGMYYFMLVRHPNGEIRPYSQAMTIKHVSSGKDLKSQYVTLLTKNFKNNMNFFRDIDTLKQHMEFDPIHTQEYDRAVSDGLSFVAVDAMQTWVLIKKNKTDKYTELAGVAKRLS